MEAKKLSFSFMKTSKKSNLIPNKEISKTVPNVELIKCLEGQEIKLVEEKPEEEPLIIPVRENQKTSAALASLMKRKAILLGEDVPDESKNKETNAPNSVDVTEDLEKRAARELLAEINSNSATDADSTLVLPVVKPDDLTLEGAKESTLDDYEIMRVEDFGKAMLRGMGWKEPPKTNKGVSPMDEAPSVRPKGMGLGADKTLHKKPLLVAPETNEVLEIKRNAYVCILAGKHKGLYGQIEDFDEYAGRVIVKMAIGGNNESFNEFLCQPVSKKEYAQYGKCINTSKYEEYKKKENKYGQIIFNQDEKYKIEKSYSLKDEKNVKKERYNSPENEDKYKICKNNSEEKKYIKKEHDRNRDSDYKREKETSCHRRDRDSYDDKYHSRNDRRERKSSRDREYRKDNIKIGNGESKLYEFKIDNHRERERERDFQQYYAEHDRSSYKYRQQERERNSYLERSEKRENKIIDVRESSSETQNDSRSSKHKKTKKTSLKKKSNKTKKNKFKYKSESSDTDTTSSDTDSSSSSSEEERRRKHKKKTKKSKKQRERSRSKDRR